MQKNIILNLLLALSQVLFYGYQYYSIRQLKIQLKEQAEKLNSLSFQSVEKLVPTKEVLVNELTLTPNQAGLDLNLFANYTVQVFGCIIIAGICYYYILPYVSSYFAIAFFPLVKKPLEDKTKEVIDKVMEEVVSSTVDSLVSSAIPLAPQTIGSNHVTINEINSGLLSTANIETSSTVTSITSTVSIAIEDTILLVPSIVSSSSSTINNVSSVDTITSILIREVSPGPLIVDVGSVEVISDLVDVIVSRGPEEVLSSKTLDLICQAGMKLSGLIVRDSMATTPSKERTGDHAQACIDLFNSLPP